MWEYNTDITSGKRDLKDVLIEAITPKVNEIRTHTVSGIVKSEEQLIDIIFSTLREYGLDIV